MGDIVANQGDLLNRIDENLTIGLQNVSNGKAALRKRVER